MKILQILNLDKKSLDAKKAERKAKSLKRNQEKLVDNLEDKRDDMLRKKEDLLAVTMDSATDSWNEQLQNILVELKMIDVQIEIAKLTMDEFFTETSK